MNPSLTATSATQLGLLSLYDSILSNIEDISYDELNNLLDELQIKHLTDILVYKFPNTPRSHLQTCLVQEYFA